MPDRYRIIVLLEASNDLTAIFDYIEQHSPQNAVTVARRLVDAIDSLDRFPHRCKIHVSNSDPQRVVHSMPVGPFIIYYRVLEARGAVEIMTIRHGARRQPRRF